MWSSFEQRRRDQLKLLSELEKRCIDQLRLTSDLNTGAMTSSELPAGLKGSAVTRGSYVRGNHPTTICDWPHVTHTAHCGPPPACGRPSQMNRRQILYVHVHPVVPRCWVTKLHQPSGEKGIRVILEGLGRSRVASICVYVCTCLELCRPFSAKPIGLTKLVSRDGRYLCWITQGPRDW